MEFSAKEEGNTVQCSYCQFDVVSVGTGQSLARRRKEIQSNVAIVSLMWSRWVQDGV